MGQLVLWSTTAFYDAFRRSDSELDRALVSLLARKGPECPSKLAVDLNESDATRVEEILRGLEKRGVVERRPYRGRVGSGLVLEGRWGLRLASAGHLFSWFRTRKK